MALTRKTSVQNMVNKTYQTKSAVLIVAFNRPEHTKKILEAVASARPRRLYVAVDGPREDHPEDISKTAAVRALFDDVGWECEVFRKFSSVNLGCCYGPYSAFNWVFEQEESAIILEDDCLPAPAFFPFCDELLKRYADDTRVMLISGTNAAQRDKGGWKRGGYSYLFSRFGGIHGLACWRRAWRLCDLEMTQWENPVVRELLRKVLGDRLYHWRTMDFDLVKSISEKKNLWDTQWLYSRLINSGLDIVPAFNLISNIGFDETGTHTFDKSSPFAKIPYGKMPFPLKHPEFVLPDTEYDEYRMRMLYPRGKAALLMEDIRYSRPYRYLSDRVHGYILRQDIGRKDDGQR